MYDLLYYLLLQGLKKNLQLNIYTYHDQNYKKHRPDMYKSQSKEYSNYNISNITLSSLLSCTKCKKH